MNRVAKIVGVVTVGAGIAVVVTTAATASGHRTTHVEIENGSDLSVVAP